jgi:hypothetical protein
MPRKTKAILGLIALAVLVTLVIFGHEPSGPDTRDTCAAKGIDPAVRKEGTCYVGKTKTVVVDPAHTLELATLDARLAGVRESAALRGPQGIKLARGTFVTYDLAITNRTGSPAAVGQNQVVLRLGQVHGEDVEAEEGYEPDSFLAQGKEISPGATMKGSVTFDVPAAQLQEIGTNGNLDIADFGPGQRDYEPERMFDEAEVGVIRTYRRPKT